MKTMTFNGVPYSVSGDAVYIYGTTTQIGSYNGVFTLSDTWQRTAATILTEYRNRLDMNTKAALTKAAELQKA